MGISKKQLVLSIGVLSVIAFLLFFVPLSYKFSKNKSAMAVGWYSYDWNYRKSITIDHTKVASDATDYPLLISLDSDADLANKAQSDGDDILFTSVDGITKLSHEIEKFNENTGELVVYVKIPELSSTEDTKIYLYYANSTCSNQQNATGVWNSSFAAVHHMEESADTFYDSTSNNNDAAQYGGVTYQTTGKIGKAVAINGAEDHLRVTDDSSIDLSGNISLSTWIKSKNVSDELIDISDIEIDNDAKGTTYPVDLDQDGSMDILSADTGVAAIIWYKNDGLENFTKYNLNSITNPYDIITYDFDNDGDIDIAGTSQYNDVFLLENDGSENFTRQDIYTAWNQGHRISLSDINSDGYIDILATSYYSNQWAWFANDGSGNFSLGATVNSNSYTHSISAADIDDDGDIDTAVTAYGADDVLFYQNDGNENFTQINIDDVVDGPQTVYIVDLDEDGDQDIIAAADVSHRVYWYSNDGNENFTKVDLLGYVRNANHCMPIDMDNDGDIDILGSGGHSDTGVRWYENNGSEVFTTHIIKFSVYGAGKPSAVDIDSDGDLDIVAKFVYSTNIHSLYLWKNNGVGIFNKASQIFKNQNGFSAYIRAGGYVQVLLSDAEQNQCKLTSSTTIDDDAMHHLALTWDTSNLKIYIDGALNASTTCSGISSLNSSNYLNIGRGADAIFDEFVLRTSLLSPEDISTLYYNQNSPSTFYSIDSEEQGDETDPTNPNSISGYSGSNKETELTTDTWYNYPTPYFEWSGASDTQSGVAGYYVYFGTSVDADPITEGKYQTASNYNSTTLLVSGNTYVLRVATKDDAGNESLPVTLFTYKYDNQPPEPPLYVNVSPVGCSTKSSFTFAWSESSDSGGSGLAGYEYKKGSSGTPTAIGDALTVTATAYQEGDNVFYVRAYDNAGNYSSWQTTVYCATGVALIIDGPTVVAGPSSITVDWVSSKATTGYIKVYDGNTYISEQGLTNYSMAHSVKVIGLEPEKNYRYQITWTDQSGNLGESEWYNTTTATAPQINNFKIEVLSPTALNISWVSTVLAKFNLEYGIGNYSTVISSDNYSNSYSRKVDNLSAGSAYQFRVNATSEDGTKFFAGESVIMPPLPIIENLKFEPIKDRPDAAMKVTWTTNVELTSTIYYGLSGEMKKEISKSDKVKEHEIIIGELLDNSEYQIYVSGIDQYGNIAKSNIQTFKTDYDSRPPKINNISTESSNVASGKTDKAQITVGYTTDEPAKCFVDYGAGISGDNYTGKTVVEDILQSNHISVISDLTPQTPYHFKITCFDKAGNKNESADQTVISGEITLSVFNIILKTLNNLFGWLGKLSK